MTIKSRQQFAVSPVGPAISQSDILVHLVESAKSIFAEQEIAQTASLLFGYRGTAMSFMMPVPDNRGAEARHFMRTVVRDTLVSARCTGAGVIYPVNCAPVDEADQRPTITGLWFTAYAPGQPDQHAFLQIVRRQEGRNQFGELLRCGDEVPSLVHPGLMHDPALN